MQPGDIFCLLQELSENGECEQSQEKAITPISESVSGGIIADSSNGTNDRIPTPRMVGLSSAELESLNELIQIDHVYVKPQPLIQIGGKEGQHKYTAAVLKQENNGSIVPTLNKPVALSGLKRNHTGDVVGSVPQPAEPITVSITGPSPLDFGRINANTTSVVEPSSVSTENLNLEESEFINTLSDTDMETSLNFFHDFNIDLIQSNCDTEVNKSSNIQNSFFNLLQNTQLEDLTTEKDLNATKLFDEIYEHYLSIKDSSLNSPDSHSDSGISSDIDPLSPQSSEGEFINDQLMWQDTSFADLFPDLQ